MRTRFVMKKIKIISPVVYFVAFFVLNLFNAYTLTSGYFHANLSVYQSVGGRILAILGDFGVLLLLFCATCLIFKKNRGRCNTLMILSIILTVVILFLTVFSNMFSLFFSFSQLTSFQNPAQMSLILEYAGYIFSMFGQGDMLIHIVPLVLYIILRFFIHTADDKKYARTSHKLLFMGNSVVFMMIPLIVLNVNAKGTIQEVSMTGLYGSSFAGTYNYYLYSASEVIFKKQSQDATSQEREILTQFLEQYNTKNMTDLTDNAYYNLANEKNLVILQLEAFNNFALQLKVDGKEITPNLNQLLEESYYNYRFYSTAGIGNTSDCEFSVLTGLYPNGNDLAVFDFNGKNYPSLAKDFKEKGYATFSIHGNDGAFYNRDVQHIQTYGFERHIDREEIIDRMESRNEKAEIFGEWISDECLLQESIQIFEEYYRKNQPFFAYDILVTSHTPFIKNKEIEKLNLDGVTHLAESCLDYYHYVDSAIGAFFDELKTNHSDLYANTVFVLFGDHTSSIMKNDLESILNQKLDNVQYRLLMQSVPFIIHCPSLISDETDSRVRGQVDIYPTMSNLFGLDSPYKIGADIFSDDESLIYSPRTLDIIYNDYVVLSPSKKVYYTNDKITPISKKKIETIIEQFQHYKYYNDMLMNKNYFK